MWIIKVYLTCVMSCEPTDNLWATLKPISYIVSYTGFSRWIRYYFCSWHPQTHAFSWSGRSTEDFYSEHLEAELRRGSRKVSTEGGPDSEALWPSCSHRGTHPSTRVLWTGPLEWRMIRWASELRISHWASLSCQEKLDCQGKSASEVPSARFVCTSKRRYRLKMAHNSDLLLVPSLSPCSFVSGWLQHLRALWKWTEFVNRIRNINGIRTGNIQKCKYFISEESPTFMRQRAIQQRCQMVMAMSCPRRLHPDDALWTWTEGQGF